MSELAVGKVIRMPCMRKGLCAYHDETILLTQESLDQLSKTAHGIPVTIEHPSEAITDQNVESLSVGRVSRMDYDPSEDLWYAEFVVETEEAAKYLRDGWGVSTAWYGDEYAPGGTLNNVPYDREVKKARYEHLAIVKNPRYEMAVGARFLNSRNETGHADVNPVKMETKPTPPPKGSYMLGRVWKMMTVKEEIKTNENEDLHVEIDGEAKPLKNVLDEMKALKEKKESAAPEKRMLCADDEVEVDGKKMKVGELVEAYKAALAPKEEEKKEGGDLEVEIEHEEEPKMEAGKDESEEEKPAEASKEDGEEKKEEKKKENDRFAKMKEVHENGIEGTSDVAFVSTRERVDMGRARYGSK